MESFQAHAWEKINDIKRLILFFLSFDWKEIALLKEKLINEGLHNDDAVLQTVLKVTACT